VEGERVTLGFKAQVFVLILPDAILGNDEGWRKTSRPFHPPSPDFCTRSEVLAGDEPAVLGSLGYTVPCISCFSSLSDRAHPLSLLIAASDTSLIVQSRRSHLISPVVASNLPLGLQLRSRRFVSYTCPVPIFILPFLSSSQSQPFFATVSSRFPVCCSLELRVLPVAFR